MGDVNHAIKIIKEFSQVTKKYPFSFGFKLQYRDLKIQRNYSKGHLIIRRNYSKEHFTKGIFNNSYVKGNFTRVISNRHNFFKSSSSKKSSTIRDMQESHGNRLREFL